MNSITGLHAFNLTTLKEFGAVWFGLPSTTCIYDAGNVAVTLLLQGSDRPSVTKQQLLLRQHR